MEFRGGGNTLSSSNREKFLGFTLAEMMVVMLILSIILAAMAPVMTSRNKTASSSKVWDWDSVVAANNVAYLRSGNPVAVIGLQNGGYNNVSGQRDDARLIINSRDVDGELLPQISFLYNSNNAGRFLMHGSNVFLGQRAGSTTMSSSAQKNVGIGADALSSISTGSGNTSVGAESSVTTTGSNNTTLGYMALKQAGGDNNVAIGAAANNVNNSFSNTVAVGYTTTAIGNGAVVVGSEAIANGSGAVAIGNLANSSTSSAISIGDNAKASNVVAISIGYHSEALGTSGISIGTNAKSTSAGIAIGDNATSRESSIVIGSYAKVNNTSGLNHSSVAIGPNAKGEVSSIAIGPNTTADNSAIAIGAGYIQTGYPYADNRTVAGRYSVAVGFGAKTGSGSVAIGPWAEANGDNNVAIGYNACRYVTGSNKTCIGANSGPGPLDSHSSDSSKVMFLGDSGTTVVIPGALIVGQSVLFGARSAQDNHTYHVYLKAGNRSASDSWAYLRTHDYSGTDDNFRRIEPVDLGSYRFYNGTKLDSDRRLKYVGKENTSGLDKIRQLKVFNYAYKKDAKKTPHVGVIAQDLQKVFPNAVTKAKDGFLQIRMEDMFYAIINAVKELDAKVTALTKEVKIMSEILKQVQSDNAQIKKDNQQLKRENQELRKMLKQVQDDNKKEAARLKALEGRVK